MFRSMNKKWQPKVTTIKESHDLKTLDVFTLLGKLTDHEHKLKRLQAREVNAKKKEKVQEDKRNVSLKASTFKDKVDEDD